MYYDFYGNPIQKAYSYNGSVIWEDTISEYATFDEAVKYAYQRAIKQDAPFCLIADQHTTITAKTKIFANLSSYADWSKMLFIDVGDDELSIGYDEVQAQTVGDLENELTALSSIPSDRQIKLMGNHDTWWKDADGVTHMCTPSNPSEAWILKYFANTGCTQLFGNDVVYYDDANNIKYISVSGWERDDAKGGYSHYNMSADHLDVILAELSKSDGYDIVLLSHVGIVNTFDGGKYIPPTDGNTTQETTIGTGKVVTDMAFNQLLDDRNNYRTGSINDTYRVSHSYDFTGCTGNILYCLFGHEHVDLYGYDKGILHSTFDSMHYDHHPIFFGGLNRAEEKLMLWKVDDSPMVYEYALPLHPTT